MKYLVLSMAITCCLCGTYRAADDTSYIVSPYNDTRDHTEAFTIIAHNVKKLYTQLNGKLSDPIEQKNWEKLHERLHNNTHCSPLLKPLEKRFFRIVLRNQHKLIGIADFYENAIDYDSIKKHDGYCETLLTDEEHTAHYPTLIAAALKQCEDIGVKRFVHYLVNNQVYMLP